MFARSLASAARRGIGPTPAIRLRLHAPPALPAVGRVPHNGASRCLATSGTGGGPAPPPGSGDEKKADEKKESRWTRIKATFRQHGLVFVGYYTATWVGGFGVCWGGVSIAGLDGVTLLHLLPDGDGTLAAAAAALPERPSASCNRASHAFSSGFDTDDERDNLAVDSPLPLAEPAAAAAAAAGGEGHEEELGDSLLELILAFSAAK